MPPLRDRRVAALIVAGGMVFAGAGRAATTTVRCDAGRLTLHAAKTPIGAVLSDVARACGATIRGTPVQRDVSADLDDVPVDEALVRLLGKDNVALTYGADGRLRTIALLGAARAPSAWPPLASVPSSEANASVEHVQEVMNRPVEVTGRLAAALGTRRPTAGQVVLAALQQPSGKVRSEAQHRALAAFDSDPEIEDVFARTLLAVDDATLARMMRDWRGDHGEGFLAKLAERARSPELRAKAAAVVEQLRAVGPPEG